MNILITGGAGFIGSNLSLRLLADGHHVTILDNLSPQIHGDNPADTSPLFRSVVDKVNVIHGDVRNRADWEKSLCNQDVVVHFAAETGTGQSMYEIQRYVDVNISGTAHLLELLTNSPHQVKKVIIASSRSIYGEGKYRHPQTGEISYPTARQEADMQVGKFQVLCPKTGVELELLATDEDSKIHPSSVYGITKQNQEQMVMTVCASIGVAAVALRYQNVYGPGQSLSNPYTGILSIFSTRIKNGNDINVFEDGLESRDFVYIDDVVDATYRSITDDRANNQVFGVGSGVATTVIEVAETLKSCYGAEVAIHTTGNFRLGDIRHNYADLTKIRALLNFEPQFDFKTGIRNFAAWVNEQAIQTDNYDKSMAEMKAKGLFK